MVNFTHILHHCDPHFRTHFNTLRPRQNGRHLPDDIFKCIFMNENVWISLKISLKFVPKVPINNIPALVLIMAWCRPGDKPLSEPMMVSLPMHICVTWPQWVTISWMDPWGLFTGTRGRFKKTHELLNLRALKISVLYKNHIFQCTCTIFCVDF